MKHAGGVRAHVDFTAYVPISNAALPDAHYINGMRC